VKEKHISTDANSISVESEEEQQVEDNEGRDETKDAGHMTDTTSGETMCINREKQKQGSPSATTPRSASATNEVATAKHQKKLETTTPRACEHEEQVSSREVKRGTRRYAPKAIHESGGDRKP
jgi:hypothetical protein